MKPRRRLKAQKAPEVLGSLGLGFMFRDSFIFGGSKALRGQDQAQLLSGAERSKVWDLTLMMKRVNSGVQTSDLERYFFRTVDV